MAANNLVSVVIPVFNGESTITAAVRSALAQTHRDVEVIVVDDASTDATGRILSGIGDPRLRCFRHTHNLGEGRTRDRAIAEARGEWVAMLDGDDAWHPRRLEILLARLDARPGLMVADNILHCYPVAGGLQEWRPQWRGLWPAHGNGEIILDLAGYLDLQPLLLKPIIPRRPIVSHDIRHSALKFSADTEYFVRVMKSGLQLLLVNEPLYLHCRSPGSMSDNPDRAALMRGMFLVLLDELDFTAGESAAVRARIALLGRQVRYLPFLFDLKHGRWRSALQRARADPFLLGEFLARLPESLAYRLHFRLHGGRSSRRQPADA